VKTAIPLSLAALVLSGSLVACGGSDKPAVCGSVDDLRSSVSALKDIKLTSSGAVGRLQTSLDTIKSNVETVKADAKTQFSTQLDALDSSYTALKAAADTARSAPSVATFAAAATALSTFSSAAQTLVSDIQATC
jgi:hypothetical protein